MTQTNMTQLADKWMKQTAKDIKSINKMLTSLDNDCDETKEFRKLANWMIKGQYSPHDYMDSLHVSFGSNSEQTEFILSQIKHALTDDGDISFVKMFGNKKLIRVFMCFRHHKSEGFRSFCLKENKNIIETHMRLNKDSCEIFEQFSHKAPQKLLTTDDFTFISHHNPEQFILEFENLQKDTKELREKQIAFINQARMK